MKRLLLLFISLLICSIVYSEELMEKKEELKEQIVKNFNEKNIDTDLIIEYAKLFLPEKFHYDDDKMRTPYFSEDFYSWRISFILKDEYITEDLYKDGVAIFSYTVDVRKLTGEARITGVMEKRENIYRKQYESFKVKTAQYDSLLKGIKDYNLLHEYYKRMNNLIYLCNSVTENNIASSGWCKIKFAI